MRPRLWWGALRVTSALGPRASTSLARLARSLVANGANLYGVVRWRAAQEPDQLAIVDVDGSLSYPELADATEAVARWLVANRLDRGGRIGVYCRRPRNAILTVLACQRLGLGAVLLNTFASSDELDALVGQHHLPVVSDDEAYGDLQMPEAFDTTTPLPRPVRRRAPTVAILTSGSTGTPKVIDKRPPINAVDTVAAFVAAIGARRGDHVTLMLPVFHGHGLATAILSLALGGTLTLRPPADQRDDSFGADWTAITAGATDLIVAVPTVLKRLLAAAPDVEPAGKVRAIVSGSAPIDAATVAAVTERFGSVLHNVYGSSEAGVIAHAGPTDLAVDPTTVGRPLPGVECEIRRTADAGPDGVGEVWVRGGMAGRDWLDTRDLGELDVDGRLRLHGRADSVLVIGGEKVAPEALEERIATMPEVVECAVRGIPDDEYGTRAELIVVLEPGTTVDELRLALEESLPRTLRPASIIVVDALPRTALGKLQRRALPDDG